MRKLQLASMSLLLVALALLPSGSAADTAAGPAIHRVASVMILVDDQDKALQWYTEKLGFVKKVDEKWGQDQRWLTVVAPGDEKLEIVLEKAGAGMEGQIGKGTAWVLETADCMKAYETLRARGVEFAAAPQVQSWGTQAVFKDLYGNRFTLISAPPAQK